MEEQNNPAPAPQSPLPPPAAPQPAQPGPRGAAAWLKAIAVLYALSLFAAFAVLSRADAARKAQPKDMDMSKIAGLGKKKDSVAVIPLYGVISQGASSRSWDRGSQQTAKRIKTLAAKKEVKAIVLDINSPGGSVGAVQEIYSAVLKAKAETKKPFIARFGEVSASGGYYVAAACDKIVAHPGTITGSIGVIFSVANIEGLMKKIGYKSEAIKSGKHKDIGSMTRELTVDERKLLQGMIDDSYEQFVAAVAQGRKMTPEQVKVLADGRIYTGRQAKENGLVDEMGDLQDAIDAAGTAAGLGKNPQVLSDGDPLENFFSLLDTKLSLFGSQAVADAVNPAPRLEYRWSGR
ncbi:MAG: signal peptide peptidase SppA [Elusimicrobiales bacterium]|nr:signal peptide peptidase SppA [Elusimicrobiales bacterium]